MWLDLKKGDKVRYLGFGEYIASNGQIFKGDGEMFINSEVQVQKEFFEQLKAEEPKVEKEEVVEEEVVEEKPKAKAKTVKKAK